jgi:UDPglucose 6-dehydrogenase
VAVWGLAFKPGTDDLREAASLVVLRELVDAGATVAAYDPVAMRNAVAAVPAHARLEWRASAADALTDANVLVLLTEWREFIDFPPERVAEQLKDALVIDGRNALPTARWEAAGLQVHQVGRPVGDAHPSVPVMPWRDAGDPRARPAAAAGTS